jgi:hypothetical protein
LPKIAFDHCSYIPATYTFQSNLYPPTNAICRDATKKTRCSMREAARLQDHCQSRSFSTKPRHPQGCQHHALANTLALVGACEMTGTHATLNTMSDTAAAHSHVKKTTKTNVVASDGCGFLRVVLQTNRPSTQMIGANDLLQWRS